MTARKTYNHSPPRKKSADKKGRKLNRLWIGLGLTSLAMLSTTAGALLAITLSATPLRQTQLTLEEQEVFRQKDAVSRENLQPPELTRPVNILVLGTKVLTSDVEQSPQADQGYYSLVNSLEGVSDTMLLLRLEPDTEELTLLSIPRDTRVRVEGHGVMKINAANQEGGITLAAKAVSNLLGGVTIDRYARVNVQGVEKLIDALGGVTVYVPKDMKYSDDSQHLYIDLEKGQQHLNGDKAIEFMRFRHDHYGDIGRVQRQQMLMRAAMKQALKPSVLVRIPRIFSVVKSNLDTNLSVEELVALTRFATKTEQSDVQMLMLPGQFSGNGQKYKGSYWLPNDRRIDQMMAKYFQQGERSEQEKEINPATVRVAIQDSTGEPEAVQELRQSLREAGYGNVYVARDHQKTLQETRIVAQKGDNRSAKAIREALGMGEVRVESTGALRSDVTIQLGEDWLRRQD